MRFPLNVSRLVVPLLALLLTLLAAAGRGADAL